MDINQLISLEAIDKIRIEIEKAGGNEVFFRGTLNQELQVQDVEALARGNISAAPAILNRVKKNDVIIHNHPSGYLYPSDADIEVASYHANKNCGAFYIVNNLVTEIYTVVEVHNEKNVNVDITPYFEEKGVIASHFKEFEYREEQLHMAKLIEAGFNREKKVIVEAGTGTGKTLAYLIPGIEWAVKNKKRIIFSTNTINLQEQLLNKDIPLAKKVLGYDFKYMLVKGRGNFLCNRKFYNLVKGEKPDIADFSTSQKNQFAQILKWGSNTKTGDKSELTFETDSSIWENFNSESDICLGNKCEYRGECFFFRARDEKKNADVLITNHHLYFADLSIRKGAGFSTEFSILPEYHAIVFDEAHNIEKVARDYFSIEVSKFSFVKLMNKIENIDNKKKNPGILSTVEKECNKGKDSEIIKSLIQQLRVEHKEFIKEIRKYFDEIIINFTTVGQESASIRLKPKDASQEKMIKKLEELTSDISITYKKYSRIGKSLIKILKEQNDENGNKNELIKYLDRVNDAMSALLDIDKMEDQDAIYWMDINRKRSNAKRVSTPLKIKDELQENLFSNIKTVVFTSATIAVGNDFKYFKESIGLEEDVLEKVIHSPFDYNSQMDVYIPCDMGEPTAREFNNEAAKFLIDLIKVTKGNCFILFTSYSALNYIYYSIRSELEKNGIECFVHGTAPRTQLIEMYKKSANPVLFGTDSFWEGVDIRGEKLSTVVIVKLPFKVPNDPITEAIIENLTLLGKNSFTEYQIPEAVIKFKQGIGRLIRSKSDRGNIVILDNRIINKRYGKYFIEAIPSKNICTKEKKGILREIFQGGRE